jgi:hypothetical protein
MEGLENELVGPPPPPPITKWGRWHFLIQKYVLALVQLDA